LLRQCLPQLAEFGVPLHADLLWVAEKILRFQLGPAQLRLRERPQVQQVIAPGQGVPPARGVVQPAAAGHQELVIALDPVVNPFEVFAPAAVLVDFIEHDERYRFVPALDRFEKGRFADQARTVLGDLPAQVFMVGK
jgi:hypothetical protein